MRTPREFLQQRVLPLISRHDIYIQKGLQKHGREARNIYQKKEQTIFTKKKKKKATSRKHASKQSGNRLRKTDLASALKWLGNRERLCKRKIMQGRGEITLWEVANIIYTSYSFQLQGARSQQLNSLHQYPMQL